MVFVITRQQVYFKSNDNREKGIKRDDSVVKVFSVLS